jgi:hypothetical protein
MGAQQVYTQQDKLLKKGSIIFIRTIYNNYIQFYYMAFQNSLF